MATQVKGGFTYETWTGQIWHNVRHIHVKEITHAQRVSGHARTQRERSMSKSQLMPFDSRSTRNMRRHD